MLTKAILTGGVLSVLAGSIVYFGTEGADASEAETGSIAHVDETALAGAPEIADATRPDVKKGWGKLAEVRPPETGKVSVADPDIQDPPPNRSKPKTRWLDQYLKKTKPKDASDETVEAPTEMASDSEDAPVLDSPDAAFEAVILDDVTVEIFDLEQTEPESSDSDKADREDKDHMRHEKRENKKARRGEAEGTYIVSEGSRSERLDIEGLDIDAFDLYASELDGEADINVDAILEELDLGSEENVEIRVVKKINGKPSRPIIVMNAEAQIDYDLVLDEAKKLLVTDMRNQAFLEVVDYAIDQDDVMRAADIVDELSTPELRDTARARIGVGLARRGDTEAAFAVIDDLEIDELSAPIRLEIITALMATKQERENFGSRR